MQPLLFLQNGFCGKPCMHCSVIKYMLLKWQRLRDAKQFSMYCLCFRTQMEVTACVTMANLYVSGSLWYRMWKLSLSLKNIKKWLGYLLCIQKETSFRHGLLKLYYGIMMCGVLRPSICGSEKGMCVCVCEGERELKCPTSCVWVWLHGEWQW